MSGNSVRNTVETVLSFPIQVNTVHEIYITKKEITRGNIEKAENSCFQIVIYLVDKDIYGKTEARSDARLLIYPIKCSVTTGLTHVWEAPGEIQPLSYVLASVGCLGVPGESQRSKYENVGCFSAQSFYKIEWILLKVTPKLLSS